MKYIKYIMAMVAMAFAVSSCDTEIDTVTLPQSSEYVAPVLDAQATVVVNEDNVKTESVVFTCTEADFGTSVSVQYSLYLTKGEAVVMAGRSYYPSITILKGDFNGFVVNSLKVPANSTAEIGAYVVAAISDTEVVTPASNTVMFNVSTFKAELRRIYVVGSFQGWAPEKAPQIFESAGGTNIFEGVVNFTEDIGTPGFSPFKITNALSWNEGNWGFDAFTCGANFTKTDDGNLVLPAGIWKIAVNLTAMTIDAEAYATFGLTGGCNGWAEAQNELFTYDVLTGLWKSEPLTFSDDLGFLIRKANDWDAANKFGDSGEQSQDIEGGINLLQSSSATNILVPEAGTYVFTVHANRSPYVLVMEKQ